MTESAAHVQSSAGKERMVEARGRRLAGFPAYRARAGREIPLLVLESLRA